MLHSAAQKDSKELAVEILSIQQEDYSNVGKRLKHNGFAILNTTMREEACDNIIEFINDYPSVSSEFNYGGTEKRIWKAEESSPVVNSFALFSNSTMKALFEREPAFSTVLAYRNFPISHDEDLRKGRWHLDSFRPQYKLFCFLTKTTELSGPLEIVPGTMKIGFKVQSLLKGKCFGYSDLVSGNRRYQQLNDSWVANQCSRVGGSLPILCEKGALVIVNTSAIHRARPCLEGCRYALSVYYGHF